MLMTGIVPLTVHANSEFDSAVRAAIVSCSNIGPEFNELKKMAGINTGITATGTAIGGGAVAVGFAKTATDKQIAELEQQICDAGGCDPDRIEKMSDTDFFNNVLQPMALIAELNRMNARSKRLGNWRTGLMAGNTATNIAGAVIAGKNRTDKTTREIIDGCVSAVQDLRRITPQARLDGTDNEQISYAENIISKCGGWEYVNLDKIDRRANGAMWSSITGTAIGTAGVVTSAVANSDRTRMDNTDAGKRQEKNLNTASNALAIGATAASATATVFNATQIAAIKQAVETAAECEAALN